MGRTDTQWPDFQVEPLEPRGGGPSRTSRNLPLAGLAAALVVALIATSLAVVAAMHGPSGQKGGGTIASGTATPYATSQATVTDAPTATPTNAPFVCANPVGSTRTYVFLNADHQLYRVTGCSAPVRLTHLDAATQVAALAFSPANRWLMVSTGKFDGTGSSCQALMNPQTGALTPTTYCLPAFDANWTTYPTFIGWLNDATFLESITAQDLSVKVVRVSAATLQETGTAATIKWAATGANRTAGDSGIRIAGGYLYYGGYASASEGGAWLHRVPLTSGADTKLVPLGLAGSAGCQAGNSPCTWTGPWDVTPDGTRITYHNPGPTISLSDTTNPPETPLYIANPDGSAALKLTSPATGENHFMSAPALSPTGAWVTAPDASWKPVLLSTSGSGATIALPAQSDYQFAGWQSDGESILLYRQGPNYSPGNAIFTLATKAITNLANYTQGYVWGA